MALRQRALRHGAVMCGRGCAWRIMYHRNCQRRSAAASQLYLLSYYNNSNSSSFVCMYTRRMSQYHVCNMTRLINSITVIFEEERGSVSLA